MTSADEDWGSHRRPGGGRRGPAHAKTSPRWPDPGSPGYQDAGPPVYQADHYQAEFPDWTGQPRYQAQYPEWAGQQAYQAQYPEWTGQQAYQPEYLQWTGQREHPGWSGQQAEYPGQPGHYGQHALHPDHPSWPESRFAPWPAEEAVIDHRPSAVAVAPPLPVRTRPRFNPQPEFPPRADVPPQPVAPRRDIPLHRDMNFNPAPIMQDTITDLVNWAQPDVRPAQPAGEQTWDAGSSRLANWIIEDANEQAAEITREARNQASSSLADAHREAAELVRRTGEQAALTLEAAELQAAEIRATMMRLTAEVTGMAAYVTQNLTSAPPSPASPAFSPPDSAPPASAPPTRRAAQPDARPGPTPTARPTGKPNARSRQHAAVRVMSVFTAAMVLFALTAGGAEVALHGFKFFVFRAAGTGETSRSGLQEQQGPGQPDAPGAHPQLQKP